MVLNDIEKDVKIKCIETETTQSQSDAIKDRG